MNQLEKTLTSLEVAEMVGRRHDQVMRDLENIISHLGDHKSVESYFTPSNYENSQRKTFPCYRLTKKGCELYSTRMTGEKGTQFAVAYIERFNEMENTLKDSGNTKLLLKAALEHEEKIETIQTDVNMLKNTMRIDGVQEHKINRLGKKVVMKALGGFESPAYQEMSSKVFARFWRDFKNHFMIPRYSELPKSQYDEGIEFVDAWQPDTSTRLEIQNINNQQTLKVIK